MQTRMDMLHALAPLLEGAHHQPNNPSGSGLVLGNAFCGNVRWRRAGRGALTSSIGKPVR